MNKEACDVSDEFPDLKNVDSKDQKMALFYITDYFIPLLLEKLKTVATMC